MPPHAPRRTHASIQSAPAPPGQGQGQGLGQGQIPGQCQGQGQGQDQGRGQDQGQGQDQRFHVHPHAYAYAHPAQFPFPLATTPAPPPPFAFPFPPPAPALAPSATPRPAYPHQHIPPGSASTFVNDTLPLWPLVSPATSAAASTPTWPPAATSTSSARGPKQSRGRESTARHPVAPLLPFAPPPLVFGPDAVRFLPSTTTSLPAFPSGSKLAAKTGLPTPDAAAKGATSPLPALSHHHPALGHYPAFRPATPCSPPRRQGAAPIKPPAWADPSASPVDSFDSAASDMPPTPYSCAYMAPDPDPCTATGSPLFSSKMLRPAPPCAFASVDTLLAQETSREQSDHGHPLSSFRLARKTPQDSSLALVNRILSSDGPPSPPSPHQRATPHPLSPSAWRQNVPRKTRDSALQEDAKDVDACAALRSAVLRGRHHGRRRRRCLTDTTTGATAGVPSSHCVPRTIKNHQLHKLFAPRTPLSENLSPDPSSYDAGDTFAVHHGVGRRTEPTSRTNWTSARVPRVSDASGNLENQRNLPPTVATTGTLERIICMQHECDTPHSPSQPNSQVHESPTCTVAATTGPQPQDAKVTPPPRDSAAKALPPSHQVVSKGDQENLVPRLGSPMPSATKRRSHAGGFRANKRARTTGSTGSTESTGSIPSVAQEDLSLADNTVDHEDKGADLDPCSGDDDMDTEIELELNSDPRDVEEITSSDVGAFTTHKGSPPEQGRVEVQQSARGMSPYGILSPDSAWSALRLLRSAPRSNTRQAPSSPPSSPAYHRREPGWSPSRRTRPVRAPLQLSGLVGGAGTDSLKTPVREGGRSPGPGHHTKGTPENDTHAVRAVCPSDEKRDRDAAVALLGLGRA